MLRDIATVTGSTIVCKMEGKTFDSLTLEDLGSCEKVIVKSNSTVILNGCGEKEKINDRYQRQIKSIIQDRYDNHFWSDKSKNSLLSRELSKNIKERLSPTDLVEIILKDENY